MQNDGKDLSNKIPYSIWDTRTEENLQSMQEESAEEIERTNLKSKTANQEKQP